MDHEALTRIQENNYYSTNGTAKESGTGLGLMLSKDFLSRNGGALLIESEPGKGSVFSFTVPLAQNG
jgi:signal transduction histidine kinase